MGDIGSRELIVSFYTEPMHSSSSAQFSVKASPKLCFRDKSLADRSIFDPRTED